MKPLKYFFFIFLFLLQFQHLHAQTKDIVLARQLTVHSNILHQDRSVIVYLPANYVKEKKYPVIYVLDGDQHTVYTGALMDRLADAGIIPEMIVIGILNEDRTKDLSPTHSEVDLNGKKNDRLKTSGGGDSFTAFIQKELMPYVEQKYSTMPYRVFIGHSFAGLLASHNLFSEKNIFNAYIAIDPSLWWDNYGLITKLSKNKSITFNNQNLYLASIIDTAKGIDSLSNGVGIASLKSCLEKKSFPGLRYTFENFPSETHGSVPTIAILSGLKNIFNEFPFPYDQRNSSTMNLSLVTNHYSEFSRKMGVTFSPPENLINDLGYFYLYELKNIEEAIKIFKLNVKYYPTAYNPYDSLAEAYLKKGDKENAKINYNKSLEINPQNKNAIDILKTLP